MQNLSEILILPIPVSQNKADVFYAWELGVKIIFQIFIMRPKRKNHDFLYFENVYALRYTSFLT